jgi:CRISPR-associated protein Cas5t
MIRLRVTAPFATFRHFTTGSFRPTIDFITPSAAFGLLLNIAGVEMRGGEGKNGTTLIQKGLPPIKLAIGAINFPEQQEILQQLHNYPVGTTRKEWKPFTKGSKYNILPVTRAFLSGIDTIIAIDSPDFEEKLRNSLEGKTQRKYGLPFLGDNSFILDRIEETTPSLPAYWYCCLEEPLIELDKQRINRFTITIDREDMSKTRTALFAPTKERISEIPSGAWVEVIY